MDSGILANCARSWSDPPALCKDCGGLVLELGGTIAAALSAEAPTPPPV
jgi:hypothetical protein